MQSIVPAGTVIPRRGKGKGNGMGGGKASQSCCPRNTLINAECVLSGCAKTQLCQHQQCGSGQRHP